MKKSQLRQMIKEEISLLLEQPKDSFRLNKRKHPKQYAMWNDIVQIKFPKDMSDEDIISGYIKKLKSAGYKEIERWITTKNQKGSSYVVIKKGDSNVPIKLQIDPFVDGTKQTTILNKKTIIGFSKLNK